MSKCTKIMEMGSGILKICAEGVSLYT